MFRPSPTVDREVDEEVEKGAPVLLSRLFTLEEVEKGAPVLLSRLFTLEEVERLEDPESSYDPRTPPLPPEPN